MSDEDMWGCADTRNNYRGKNWEKSVHTLNSDTHARYSFRVELRAYRSSLRSCSTKMKTRTQYGPKRK